jgi:aryl-alcohol dehydrogenase-like predicted oxidoreductase
MMEKRRFGRTGHLSSVAVFGGYALFKATPAEAERIMDSVLEAGVNHIDVAPSYGLAEERLGPWLVSHRDRFFLNCKTRERDRAGAAAELQRSLKRLETDHFDLYQFHAVNRLGKLDEITRSGGALEAVLEARKAGLVRFIGITSHVPGTVIAALDRFDFDSVLFPYNFIQAADPVYRRTALDLLACCEARDVGVMIIKTVARGPWGDRTPAYTTWYEPFTAPADIQGAVDFVLSQPGVTGLCTAGDPVVLPRILDACRKHQPLSAEAQAAMISGASGYERLFVPGAPARLA